MPGQTAVTLGPLRSIRLPPTGPALAAFPTASDTVRPFVEASDVSVPAGTFVASANDASAASARPEPPSEAVQATATSVACHVAVGGVAVDRRSLLVDLEATDRAAVATLPALSATVRSSVAAAAVSVPSATFVVSTKLASAACSSSERASLAVHVITTSSACQSASAVPQSTVGAVPSRLIDDRYRAARPPGARRRARVDRLGLIGGDGLVDTADLRKRGRGLGVDDVPRERHAAAVPAVRRHRGRRADDVVDGRSRGVDNGIGLGRARRQAAGVGVRARRGLLPMPSAA